MNIVSPSIADIRFSQSSIVHNQMGIDTIRLTPVYKTFVKTIKNMGLKVVAPSRNSPVSGAIKKIKKDAEKDVKRRYKSEKFNPVIEVVKLTKGKSVSNYMIIVRNTPLLFDMATHHKKAKDTFCMVVLTGLHQPSKKIKSEAMKHISKVVKRKSFKLHSLDVAIDTTDHRSITHNRKGAFKDNLMPYSKQGVISKGSSLYINNLEHPSISRVLYYDKYLKQTKHHKQKGVSNDLRAWKRLEITLTFDVTKRENKGFNAYIESMEFIDDLYEVHAVTQKAKIKSYADDYLIYQLNSFLDNRFMNNHESKRQFNSVDALERFKSSDFRRYILAI